MIGVDEVGRGSLAGPVAVGACFVSPRMIHVFRNIKESKQLSEAKREEWYARLFAARGTELAFAVSFVSARTIDRIGIAAAIRRALRRSLEKLRRDPLLRDRTVPSRVEVLLDGGLKAPHTYLNQRTIIAGDATVTAIAMASVVAKVERDRLMRRLHEKYHRYGWNRNVGYGTREHCIAIEKYGLSREHRETFTRRLRTRAARGSTYNVASSGNGSLFVSTR